MQSNQPDIGMANRFLAMLGSPGASDAWHFRAICPFERIDLADAGKSNNLSSLQEVAKRNSHGWGAYAVINAGGHNKASISKIRAVFVDFDEPDDHLERTLALVPFEPTVVVESSLDQHHVYWAIDDMPVDQFTRVQKQLIALLRSDKSVHDRPRVMRLPGFWHTKVKGKEFQSNIHHESGKRYAWSEFAEWLDTLRNLDTPPPAADTVFSSGDIADYDLLARMLESIPNTDDTHYDDWQQVFAAIHHETGGSSKGYELAVAWSEKSAKHNELLMPKKWASFGKHDRPTTMGTLRKLAKDNGWVEFSPFPTTASLTPVDLSDVMSSQLDPVHYAVKPWMPRRHVTLFGGHGGIGKSSLALAISAHTACGLPFAGFEVQQCSVLFVSLEDEPSIVRYRLRKIIDAYALPADQVLANMRLLDGTQGFAALMTEGTGFNAEPEFTKAFRELVRHATGAGLIIIDNASDAFDANENSRRSVRAFIRSLAIMARTNDAAVVLLAHIDKASAKNGAQGNSYSGSTAWHNSARSRLSLLEVDGRIQLAHEKANMSKKAEPVNITFRDSVPMPESTVWSDSGLTNEDYDQREIMRALEAAVDAGINVPASVTPGAYSAMKALESLPEYMDTFQGKRGSARAARAITSLARSGRIERIQYQKPNRHFAERWEIVKDSCARGIA